MQEKPTRQAEGTQAASSTGRAADRPDGLRKVVELPVSASTDLRESWVSFLARYHWDLFGSLTFRNDTHPEAAYKCFRVFLSKINRILYGPRWAKHNKGVSYCVALERQRRDVVHFHVLLADPELANMLKAGWFKQGNGRWANELNEMWNELAGFARIEEIDKLEAVQRYVSKYVLKGGEIDLGGPLMQRRLEQAAGRPKATVRLLGGGCLDLNSDSVPGPSRTREGERLPVSGMVPGQPLTFDPFQSRTATVRGAGFGTHEHGARGGTAISLVSAPSPA